MLNLTVIFWLAVIAALASFWWKSDLVKNRALTLANEHCQGQGVQLLDQSMVIRGVWPMRDNSGSLSLRRRYSFEFTSTGEQRYRGIVVMAGTRMHRIELEAHIIP